MKTDEGSAGAAERAPTDEAGAAAPAPHGAAAPAPHDDAQGVSTRAVHAGSAAPEPGASVVTPIYQTSTFFSEAVPTGPVRYTRYGNNPNHLALAEKLSALEGADGAVIVASGNAACAMALFACAGAGAHIVAQRELYGGTLRILRRELPRLGIETTFLPHGDGWADAVQHNTRALLLEVPVNPTLHVPDIEAAAQVASERRIPLVVDATFATPVNFRPLEHGADLVFHSATKYLGGHSDLSAGVVLGRAELVHEVAELMKSFGPVLDPHAVWLLERGVKTLAVRMARHNENGLRVATWLEQHPAVSQVFYPGLPSHPSHDRAARLFSGYGGVVSFMVRGGDDTALRVLQRLRLMCVAPSLGGVETLVSMPRFTSHAGLSPEERRAAGVGDGFVRLALGIEDAADLIRDLEQALGPETSSAPDAAPLAATV